MRRIDQSIRELGERHLIMRWPAQYWDHAGESLEFVLGNIKDNPFILLVKGRDGKILHVSENWPADLVQDQFPTPLDAGFSEEPDIWGPPPDQPPEPPPPFEEDIPPPPPGMDEPTPQDEDISESPPAPPPFEDDFDRPPSPHGEMGPPEDHLPPHPYQSARRPHDHHFFPRIPPDGTRPPPIPPKPMPIRARTFFTSFNNGNAWRIGVMINPEVTFVLGLNLAPYNREMNRLLWLFLMAAPAALLLIGGGGGWLAQRALRPVLTLTRTAEGITAKGLDQRIPLHEEDIEFDRLIRVFNGMMDRLEKSFQQAVRFSADAAHELKTPLTILQGELAQAVQSAQPGSEQQQALSRLLEEVQRLKIITRKLLLLSLADSGQLTPQLEPVNLSELLSMAAEDIQLLDPTLTVKETIDDNLWVMADPDLIRQVVQNLTSNAVKYNKPEGVVSLELHQTGGHVCFSIGNSGPGISEEDRERVFERFYRADKAHNRSVDGLGLGLSLSREIIRAHQGELELMESSEEWTIFRAALPGIPPPSNAEL
ncbi:MAG TPA: ATP-binding protein [Candidatus Hydrogenedentes bacterium]|nr:ATP-binding protein [Candidatus Hydrogenedentota bacterium]